MQRSRRPDGLRRGADAAARDRKAAGGIPAELRATEPDVPWREIIGMRNWMAHRYFDTVHAYVWGTVDHDLEPLLQAVLRMRTRISDG